MARFFQSKKSARDKVMDYLASRNHSERELRRKLSLRYESTAEIEDAIEFAKSSGWMITPEALTAEVTRQLGRRKKSHRYIENALRTKGLPLGTKDADSELRKARELVQTKLDKNPPFDYEQKQKIHRLLTNRGFDYETIKKVMNAQPSGNESDD